VRAVNRTSTAHLMTDFKETTVLAKMISTVLRPLAIALAAACFLLAMAAAPSPAHAVVEWELNPFWGPTVLQPGERGGVGMELGNSGDETAAGWPTVEVVLPPGVSFDTAEPALWMCSTPDNPQTVVCTSPLGPFFPPAPYSFVGGPFSFAALVQMTVNVDENVVEGTYPLTVTASGAGAAEATTWTTDVQIGGEPAGFGAIDGTLMAAARDEAGGDASQAGAHPEDFVTGFALTKTFVDPAVTGEWARFIRPAGSLKDVVVDLPAGFVGNPHAVSECSVPELTDQDCSPSTQVGIAEANFLGMPQKQMFAIYRVKPPADAPAQFAFHTDGGLVVLTPVVRSDGDWGLSVHTRKITSVVPLLATRITMWGNPASPSHDDQRCFAPSHVGDFCSGLSSDGVNPLFNDPDLHLPHPFGGPADPPALLSLPTRCTGQPELVTMHLSPWEAPGGYEPDGDPDLRPPTTWTTDVDQAAPLTGCDRLSFIPSIELQPTATAPDSPTGIDVEITVPQNHDPDGLATAHVKDTTVTLPDGMTVNPSSADGLQACSSAQIGLTSKVPVRFTRVEPACPLASKIGTVEVETPLLDEPLTGDVFVAKQGDNPFDSLLAMYLVVRGPGILGKLAAHVSADGQTGRLVTTVRDNPQMPFDTLRLHLKGGDRAPLATPPTCGEKRATATITSWAGHSVDTADTFTIDCPGSGGFAPAFTAGTTDPTGGSATSFVLGIERPDRQENLSGVKVEMPTGLLARLKGVTRCGDAQAAAGTCPASSRIGTATTGAGAGSNPFFLDGPVYLTGPYKGAPLGLAVAVHAVAGPFDLGMVIVRQALHVDRTDAHATVVSDPLPTILEGIPLRLRAVRVRIDRSGFMVNPTSCAPKQIRGTLTSTAGTTHTAVQRFQAAGCAALGFKPRLALRLTGRRQTRTGGHPGVRAVVRQGRGQAAIKRAEVRLPSALALDPDNAQALCEFADGTKPDIENHCPRGSIVGRARAVTPLLDRPLRGNAYFVKNVRRTRSGNLIRTLPMLVVALRGEIAVNLRGTASVKGKQLVSTFAKVPDAPISRFNLNLAGGRNGILTVTGSASGPLTICGRQTAQANLDGHNGRSYDRGIKVKTPCSKRKPAAGKRKLRLEK
jgi:hypothetical protein